MGVQGFYWCAYCTYFGFLVLYMQNHGYSNVQCAQAQVLIAVATLITQPLIGYLTDSFITCKKFLLVTTALAVPVAFLLQASVSSPILCYGAIVLQSILFYPAASLIDSWTMALREKDSQVQYPLTRSAGSVLYALTALAFGNVIAALGDGIIAPSFLLFSVLLFLCTCFLEETPCRNKQQKNVNQEATRRISGMEAAKTLLQNKTYVFFVLSCLLYHIANKSTGCFISNYVTNIGGDSGGLGLLMFFSAMVEFPSMMVMGKIIRRYPLGGLHLFALSGVVIKNFFFLIASSMPLLVIGRLAEGMSYGAYVYIFVEYIPQYPEAAECNSDFFGNGHDLCVGGNHRQLCGRSDPGFVGIGAVIPGGNGNGSGCSVGIFASRICQTPKRGLCRQLGKREKRNP